MGLFSKKVDKSTPAPTSEEYAKMNNLIVEIGGKYSLLKADLEALRIEVENLKDKLRRMRFIKNPEDQADAGSSGLPITKGLNTYNPFK